MPAKPLLASFSMVITQSQILERLEVQITHATNHNNTTTSTATISPDQLFTRLGELVNNRLRSLCNEMEVQIKKQRNQQ